MNEKTGEIVRTLSFLFLHLLILLYLEKSSPKINTLTHSV